MREGVKVSTQEAANIEAKTRTQSGSVQWKTERQWRLTASHFGEIISVTERRDMAKFCQSMHDPKNLNKVPAIRHGLMYESAALEKFSDITGKAVVRSGFCVDPELPFLGASPDGFVEGEEAVVEVKCPFRARHQMITRETVELKLFDFLENVDGKICLKKSHKYMYQIIGQMKLAKKSYGYFVVYTFKDLHYEKINLDEDFFNNSMLPKLKTFYDHEYCPYVASTLKL